MRRFLFVDDDKNEYLYASYVFNRVYGGEYSLDYAQSLNEAEAFLTENPVDAIILDDRLGDGLTSKDTIPVLEKKASKAPIFIVSTDVQARHLRDRIKSGLNKVIDKFDFKDYLASGAFE